MIDLVTNKQTNRNKNMSRSNREERSGGKLKYASARKRAEKKQREASFSATYLKLPPGVKLFKPKEGTMLLDILPFRAGEGNPCADEGLLHYERTYHMHARVGADGGSPYLCPRLTSKSPCPVCEHRQHLLKKSDPDDEKLIKDTSPKERQLFNVINLKDPETGIQIWDMSYHLFGKLLDARIRNSDEEDGWDQFAALKGGLTLKVTFKEKSFGGRKFLEAETIDFKPRAEDYDKDKLEEVHCLDELLIEPDYDELKEAFLEAAGPDEDDDEPKKKSKKPTDDDDDDDEDEEPVRKKKPAADEDDEDDDDEPVAKKRKPDPEDDEDDDDVAPVKKKAKPVDEDDEDDEPAPKKKGKKEDWSDFDEDDEDEKPKKKAKPDPDEDDEDEEPVRKKKPEPEDDDEDEEEPTPKKRKSRAKVKPEADEDEEDDDEEPPRVKSRKPADDDDEDE